MRMVLFFKGSYAPPPPKKKKKKKKKSTQLDPAEVLLNFNTVAILWAYEPLKHTDIYLINTYLSPRLWQLYPAIQYTCHVLNNRWAWD